MKRSPFPLRFLPGIRQCVKLLFLIVFSFFIVQAAYSQSKSELNAKKARLQKDIEYAGKMLSATSKKKGATLNSLSALNSKINAQQELIATMTIELRQLSDIIRENNKKIESLEEEIRQAKEEYAMMLRLAQKNSNHYQQLMFLFASDDLNQALKRIKYLKQFSDHRIKQVEIINKKKSALEETKKIQEASLAEKQKLRDAEIRTQELLNRDKQEQDRMIAELSKKEKELKNELKEKEKARKKLDDAIALIIKKELEAARKAANMKKGEAKNVFALTPEAIALSADFASNRGVLPWPVERGIVVNSFGKKAHPVLKGIVTSNNGVNIKTEKGSEVRAIFSGSVSGTISIPGANKAVIVRHGEYLSVYSNLIEVFVQKGDKITSKQVIGMLGEEKDSNAEIHLEIWKGSEKLDPESWLAKGQ